MGAKERIAQIKAELDAEGRVQVSALAVRLEVTEETIRRDLDKLAAQGFLIRTHGGAVIDSSRKTADVHFFKRMADHAPEKRAVAAKALEVLEGAHAVAADASTTVMEAVRLIADREDLVLLTNSTAVFSELADPKLTIVSPGGEFDQSGLALYGQVAKQVIGQYHVDLLLLSCKALSRTAGVLVSRENEADIKRALVAQADRVALLVDHSKFDKTAFVRLCDLGSIDYIVTDEEPSGEWKRVCEKAGIRLLY